jgi:AraC-like DNA-binding protein
MKVARALLRRVRQVVKGHLRTRSESPAKPTFAQGDEPLLSARLLAALVRALHGAGEDPAPLFARHGLAPAGLTHSGRIPHRVAEQVLHDALTLTGDPAFGLRVGLSTDPADHGELGLLMLAMGTPADRLEAVRRFGASWHDRLELRCERRQGLAHISIELSGLSMTRGIQDAVVAAAVHRARARMPPGWSPNEARLSYPRPQEAARYEQFLGCRVRFGGDDCGLVVPAAALGQRQPPTELLATLESFVLRAMPADPGDVRRSIRDLLLDGRLAGRWSAKGVAKALGVSRRTLDRRLEQHGTSFHAYLDGLRYEVAQNRLRSSDEYVAISEGLGFSDVRSFARAFKRWSGVTVSSFRRSRQRSSVGGGPDLQLSSLP